MLSAFIFLLLLTNLLFLVQSICGNNGNYTSNSTYKHNLITVLMSLPANIDSNSFYNTSVGQNPDRASAIALCRGDVQLHTCRECIVTTTADLLTSCPYQKQAVDWNDFCMLRYSNETILGILETSPTMWWWNTQNATSPTEFMAELRSLLDNLRVQAAYGGSLRKVAASNATGPDFQYIYALVQCTPDLSSDECSSCLLEAAADIPSCCDRKRGGRVTKPSCNLRYETFPFYNGTWLQVVSEPSPEPPIASERPLPSAPGEGDHNTTSLTVVIIIISIVASAILLSICVGILLRERRKRKPKGKLENVDGITTVKALKYALSTIKAATTDFSDDDKLGQGGFGAVYKGKLPNGREIAVKRLSQSSEQGNQEFKNEVLLLANHQHKNLVRLLGYCIEENERLLVYEFVQNASLDLFIFDPTKRSYLDWVKRFKIIIGIAKGILYLHEDSQLRIIHRDLKPSNILLDGAMSPKIADFGMARLFGQDETQGNTNKVAGTHGYMAPEYMMHGQFSIKSDVFSFGVIVLEIITGQRNRRQENEENLLSFVWKNWCKGTTANVVDPVMRSSSNSPMIMRCIHIGLLCVQENEATRPTMASVVVMFNNFYSNLATPFKPAFFMPGDYDSNITPLPEHISKEPQHDPSRNDISITELYPR